MPASVVQFESKHLHEVTEIFFESSTKKTFKDDEEKNNFFHKYLGFYLKNYPELALVFVKDDRVMGYVVASPVSDGTEIDALQPHLQIFKDHFKSFPSHLHINAHFEARGMGVGSELMKEIEKRLKLQNISGLHIMTGVDSPNQNFYKRLGFDFTVTLPFQGNPILFMGKRL
jgi:ribosomal protein S18 acetylase RimI-like enzyme